jgi:hypothetical protein
MIRLSGRSGENSSMFLDTYNAEVSKASGRD